MGTSLIWAGTWDHVDVQVLCRAGSRVRRVGKLHTHTPPPHTIHLDSTVELALGGGHRWEGLEGVSTEELSLPLARIGGPARAKQERC